MSAGRPPRTVARYAYKFMGKVRMATSRGIVSNLIETATIRKLRIRLLPFLFVLYVVAFVDRINLGFAALTMNRELAITSQQFGLAAGIFFWGYFLFEVPSNLILHKIGARVWIARILITWGTVGAGRSAEAGGAIHFCGPDSDSSKSLASGMYRFWSWLRDVYVQLLAAANHEVGLSQAVKYRSWISDYDSQSPWPDRDDHCVSSLRPHTGEAIPYGNVRGASWNCFAVAWSASLNLLLCCSVFSRGHRGIQLFAYLLFHARRIPDRLLSRSRYCGRNIGR